MSPTPTTKDYELLGVAPHVSMEELKRAYRLKVKTWHPDRYENRTSWERWNAEERFKEINGAYHRILAQLKTAGEDGAEDPHGPGMDALRPQAGNGRDGGDSRGDPPRGRSDAGKKAWDGLGGIGSLRAGLARLFSRVHERHRKVVLLILLLGVFFYANWDLFIAKGKPGPPMQTSALSTREDQVEGKQPIEGAPGPLERDMQEVPSTGSQGTGEPGAKALPMGHFTLGSTREEVLRIQGRPSQVKGRVWMYGLSEVFFKDGRVERYNNFDGNLKVRLLPSREAGSAELSFFTLGSTRDEVLMVQGTPTRVSGNRWHYGFSEIRFKDGRVESFDNFFGDLRIRMAPTVPPGSQETGRTFSIHSTKDDVLAMQGTPSSVQGNVWFYGLSSVQFRDERVHAVFDQTGLLHFEAASADGPAGR